jgi:hypothetical protein
MAPLQMRRAVRVGSSQKRPTIQLGGMGTWAKSHIIPRSTTATTTSFHLIKGGPLLFPTLRPIGSERKDCGRA